MNREAVLAILSERYPPSALQSSRDRLRDLSRRLAELDLKLEAAEGLHADIETTLSVADGSRIAEFIEGERLRVYDDLCRLRNNRAKLASDITDEQEYVRRHERAMEMMRGC